MDPPAKVMSAAVRVYVLLVKPLLAVAGFPLNSTLYVCPEPLATYAAQLAGMLQVIVVPAPYGGPLPFIVQVYPAISCSLWLYTPLMTDGYCVLPAFGLCKFINIESIQRRQAQFL